MARQALIIGLGQFGMSLARGLAQHGSEILAVDVSEERVREIAPHVADAIVLDCMDESALSSLSPEKRDICVCAIGDDNREGGIVVTALLRQFGAKWIIARATDTLHGRILNLVGAHEVVRPEHDFGDRLALRLAWRNVLNVLPLGGNIVLTELEAPEAFWGRSLVELSLPRRHGVVVSAIRRHTDGQDETTMPKPDEPLQRGDVLLLVSTEEAARLLTEAL